MEYLASALPTIESPLQSLLACLNTKGKAFGSLLTKVQKDGRKMILHGCL